MWLYVKLYAHAQWEMKSYAAQWYVMWEELSVNRFLKHSNHLKRTLIMFYNGLLFNIKYSDYGATTAAKISLYFTFAMSTVSFGYV